MSDQMAQHQQNLTSRQEEMLKNFQWDDDRLDETDQNLEPAYTVATDIFGACGSLLEWIYQTLSHHDSVLEAPGIFKRRIQEGIHPLIDSVLSNEYTFDSRMLVFDLIRAAFTAHCILSDQRHALEEKMTSIVNQMERPLPGGASRRALLAMGDLVSEGMDMSMTVVSTCPASLSSTPEDEISSTERGIDIVLQYTIRVETEGTDDVEEAD